MDIDEALTALATSTEDYRKTLKIHEASRAATIQAVLDALRAGARPTDVANTAPFSVAYVRRLARENGIEPARKDRSD
ncbi:hypothetical protein ACFWZ7_24820 [Nocardiopsis alba]|uniref:hypothetical protein n=1 Tax=Nocardiopsis alba TaxID=53437 RepID=UPI00366D0547